MANSPAAKSLARSASAWLRVNRSATRRAAWSNRSARSPVARSTSPPASPLAPSLRRARCSIRPSARGRSTLRRKPGLWGSDGRRPDFLAASVIRSSLDRFAFRATRTSGWPVSAAAATPARSIVWVFLARGLFVAKTPDYAYWILLDFLGFSRPNRDFSMGYTGFSLTEILSGPWPRRRQRRGTGA